MKLALLKVRPCVLWHLRLSAFYLPAVLLFAASLLLFHRIPEGYDRPYCAENWSLNRYIYIVLNCDSPEYLRLAVEPQDLLLPTTNRQSRPGLIFLAIAVRRILPSSRDLSQFLEGLAGHPLDAFTLDLFSAYVPYLVLNFAALWAAMVLYVDLLGRRAPKPEALLVGCLLLFNDVTKAFLFSPNTALLAIVAPLYALWCYKHLRGASHNQGRTLALLGLLTGVATTIYALFLVAVPLMLLALWQNLRERAQGGAAWRFAVKTVLLGVLSLLPALAWYLFVISKTGEFHFSEMEDYSEVVWLWQGLGQEAGLTILRFIGKVMELAYMALVQAIPAVAILVLGYFHLRKSSEGPKSSRLVFDWMTMPVLASALCVVFFAVAGMMAERLAFSAVPPLILVAGLVVDRAIPDSDHGRRRTLAVATGIVVLVQVFLLIARTGPFS